jgi:hypothetical protein
MAAISSVEAEKILTMSSSPRSMAIRRRLAVGDQAALAIGALVRLGSQTKQAADWATDGNQPRQEPNRPPGGRASPLEGTGGPSSTVRVLCDIIMLGITTVWESWQGEHYACWQTLGSS